MKSVLISIQSEWCAKIANGSKTIEVRKTRPKLETPFKCYIYCTAGAPWLVLGDVFNGGSFTTEYTVTHGRSKVDADRIWGVMNGTIIGEFVCDQIEKFVWVSYDLPFSDDGEYFLTDNDLKRVGMSYQQFADYGKDQDLYGWHISNLQIYSQPKPLREFYKCGASPMEDLDEELCCHCSQTDYGDKKEIHTPSGAWTCEGTWCEDAYDAYLDDEFALTRPPQSWCYVEEE